MTASCGIRDVQRRGYGFPHALKTSWQVAPKRGLVARSTQHKELAFVRIPYSLVISASVADVRRDGHFSQLVFVAEVGFDEDIKVAVEDA